MLTKRETRVITAFLNCIKHGEYSADYAIILLEDNARYGWMSEAAKDAFYDALDELLSPVVVEEPIEEEPVEEDPEQQPEEPIDEQPEEQEPEQTPEEE